MKIRSSFLFGLIASILCLCDAGAETIDCPAGCFCLQNGMYTDLYMRTVEAASHCGEGAPMVSKNDNLGIYKSLADALVGNLDFEFDELYLTQKHMQRSDENLTYYGLKDGIFYGAQHEIFVCPQSHPYSAKGSKVLTDCFKYQVNGNKVYYGSNSSNVNPVNSDIDIGTVNALVKDLQSALSKANKAAQDLQDALKKSNSTSSNISAKAVINSGTSEKVKDLKTKQTDSKNIRSPSTRAGNTDLDTAKALIKAGI